MMVLMRENIFDGFKAFSSIIRIFQICPKKSVRGDHRTKGGTIRKKIFGSIFLLVENDYFDERKRF